MHAGEIERSILLHAHPELVKDGYEAADWGRPVGALVPRSSFRSAR